MVGAPVNSLIVMYMVSPLRFRFSPTSTLADSVKTLFLRTSGLLLSGIVTVPPSPSPSAPKLRMRSLSPGPGVERGGAESRLGALHRVYFDTPPLKGLTFVNAVYRR